MKTEDVHMLHRLWLNSTRERGLENLHHHDLLTLAMTRFARDYAGSEHEEILAELRKTTSGIIPAPIAARPVLETQLPPPQLAAPPVKEVEDDTASDK